MTQLLVSEEADADEVSILNYLVKEAGGISAKRYAARIDAVYERLIDFPDMGSSRPALGENIRIMTVPPYIVVYKHKAGVVTILRLLHGKQLISAELFNALP